MVNEVVDINNNMFLCNNELVTLVTYNRTSSWGTNYVEYHLSINNPISIKDSYDNITRVKQHLDNKVNLRLYQYLVSTKGSNDKYYSKADVDDLIKDIDKFGEEYNPQEYNCILLDVAYTTFITKDVNMDAIISTSNARANASDRNVTILGDYYIATIISIKEKCIALAYYTWIVYTNNHKTFYNDNYFRDIIKESKINKLSDLPNKYKIITKIDQIEQISPESTIKDICLYYSKEHVSLIMHKTYLSKLNLTFLRYHGRPNFISIIKPTKPKTSYINNINTMDLECLRTYNKDTNVIDHKPYCVSYVINNTPGYIIGYDCIQQFFNMLNNNKTDQHIWLHYGSKYDNHIIIDKAVYGLDKTVEQPITVLDTNQSLIEVNIKLENCTIKLNDSYRLLPQSLKALGNAFNIDNPKTDIDSTKFTEDSFNDPKVIEYVLNDVIGLQQVLFKFQDLCTKNNYRLSNPLNFCTLTAMAKNTFYGFFYNSNKYLMELNKPCHDFIRESYKGGTVKCIKQGIYGATASYDIKSSYPASGCNPIPCLNPKWELCKQWIRSKSDVPSGLGFIKCKVYKPKVPETTPISIHEIYDIKDNGEIRTLFSEEILRGLEVGYTYYMLEHVGFNGAEKILEDFFRYIYDLKQKANKANNKVLELIFKLIINAAYGYFGFDRYDKQILRIYNITEDNLKHCAAIKELDEGDYTIRNDLIYAIQSINIMTKATNIAVASAITSYARIKLYDLAKYIQDKGYEVYYCDTDSVKCNMMELPNHPLFGTELGQADLEYKEYHCLETCFYQRKILTGIYQHKETNALKYVIKFKGINVNKVYLNNIDIIETDDKYKQDVIQCMKDCYLQNIPISISHGQIRSSRQDIIKNNPFVYETVTNKLNKIF